MVTGVNQTSLDLSLKQLSLLHSFQFVEESSLISKNSSNLNHIISEVKRSRQVITFEPYESNFNVKLDQGYDEPKSHSLRYRINEVERPDQNSFRYQNSSGLKQSFAKSEIDSTTYESLMNEFMGSYLEQRISSQKNQQPHFNHQSHQNQHETSIDAPYFTTAFVQESDDSPINRDSQITFSGSKASRIINQNQQSRLVKEQYFFLDQLKHSKKSLAPFNQSQNLLDKNKNFVQESYKLTATSPQKLKQSLQKLRHKSNKKPLSSSKQKTKVHKINLIEEVQAKSILRSGMKMSDQKYNISKQGSTQKQNDIEAKNVTFSKRNNYLNNNLSDSRQSQLSNSRNIHNCHSKSKYTQQPMIINMNLQKKDKKLNTKSRNSRSPNNRSKQNSNSKSKSSKKIDITNYLKTQKTFNVNSSKWKQQKHPQKQVNQATETLQPYKTMFTLTKNKIGMSNQKREDLQKQKRFIKIAKDITKKNIVPDYKQKSSQSQIQKSINSGKKYNYEYSYKMGSPENVPQSCQLFNTYRQKYSDQMKSLQVDQNSCIQVNDDQTDIEKDRQMIREIKKDLTKLINKISSTSKKSY